MKKYLHFIKTRLNFIGLMLCVAGVLFLGLSYTFGLTCLIIGGLICLFVCSTILIEDALK